MPKLERFSYPISVCFCVLLFASLIWLKWVGLIWKNLLGPVRVQQHLNQNNSWRVNCLCCPSSLLKPHPQCPNFYSSSIFLNNDQTCRITFHFSLFSRDHLMLWEITVYRAFSNHRNNVKVKLACWHLLFSFFSVM